MTKGNVTVGRQKVSAAASDMVGLKSLTESFGATKPLKGISVLVCVTPTPETGVFLLTLHELGAKIAACSDNIFASDDDVVAYIRGQGVSLAASSNMSNDEYFGAMEKAIASVKNDKTVYIVDDGCDSTQYIAQHYPALLDKVKGIVEQTTCGVNFLKRLIDDGKVNVPAIDINHSFTKQWFDNKIGIQQSLIHSLTNARVSLPGKIVTVFGYGPIGQGAAKALRAIGAKVNIVESDIIALMQAEMTGYTPVSAREALQTSDLCITTTGCVDTISADMIKKYAKSGITLGNIGHGREEYAVAYLEQVGKKEVVNEHIDAFTLEDGRVINSLCKGAIVNFLAGTGNMPRVMGITFSLMVLALLEMVKNPENVNIGLNRLSREVELDSARRNFPHLEKLVTRLTLRQEKYLAQN